VFKRSATTTLSAWPQDGLLPGPNTLQGAVPCLVPSSEGLACASTPGRCINGGDLLLFRHGRVGSEFDYQHSPLANPAMMKRNNNKRRGPSNGRRNKGGENQLIAHPPVIRSYGITRDVRIRFVSNAAFTGSITFQNLLDLILIGTSTTTLADLFFAVRLNSVELYSLPAVGGASTVTLIYSGATVGASGDQKAHTDTSMGIEPAHVKAAPDRLTQAGQFQPSSADVAFAMQIPTGTVVDVSLTFRNPVDGAVPIASQNAGVGLTIAQVFYRGLDGKASATTQLPNVGALATA
jgi:hypothetical protein